MSMLFPLGEKFFIDSVRHFVGEIEDPRLLAEISAFQAQEATHRRQHQRYNELLCELRGYDLDRIERPERERIDWAYRELTARRRLAGTTASEHLTAILADEMLTRKEPMAGADPTIAELWLWHGIEETEHKAVAFDVHIAVGGTISERRHALILNTFFFLKDTMRNLCIMLAESGKLWSIREWATGFHYLFIRPGVLRRIFIPWLRFLRKDFHPWQHDNRYLIDAWEEREAGAGPPAVNTR
jgi:predicted metal-dependent hydrolase